jgi:hypothetical protein
MENKYVITAEGVLVDANELRHWGIKGMKWGLRRYQNPDGSLTPAGRKRYTNPDGSLNKRGEEYYKKESARLKAEKTRLANEKKTNAKLGSLDKMRKSNSEVEESIRGKKADDDAVAEKPKVKTSDDMSDKELKGVVERLRNEEAYRDLNKKLGKNLPRTELDEKIEEMEKQKKYLELQRDIKNLTPKQENKLKTLMNKVVDEVLIPSAVSAGKETLTNYLKKTGADAVTKAFKDKTDQVTKNVKDSAEREAKRRAEADEKARKANEARSREEYENEGATSEYSSRGGSQERVNPNKPLGMTVYSEPSHQGYYERSTNTKNTGSTRDPRRDVVVDAEYYTNLNVTDLVTTRNTSRGQTHVSGYLNTPVSELPAPNIAGYLPAPKDDD